MLIHTPEKPALMLVSGHDRTSGLQERDGAWWVNFRVNNKIGTTTFVLLTEPAPAGFGDDFVEQIVCRYTFEDGLDMADRAWLAGQLKVERSDAHSVKVVTPKNVSQVLFAVRPPAETAGPGIMKLKVSGADEIYANGVKTAAKLISRQVRNRRWLCFVERQMFSGL